MHKAQKNIVSFLKKNIILAVTVIVLVTSLVSVSAMEIIAPEDFKPSKGVQRILNLDNKKSESQIVKSEELESEPSSVASSFSSSVVSSSVSQSETSEEKIVGESSSVSSSSKQKIMSSNSSSYSASMSSSSASSVSTTNSPTSVKPTIKTQGSPLCRINDEKPEVARKQREDMDGGSHNYKKVRYLYYKDSSQIKEDKSWWLNTGGMVMCYSAEEVDESLSFWFKDSYQNCSQSDEVRLQKILQIKFNTGFKCVKQSKNEPKSFDYVVYNSEINEVSKVIVDNNNDFKDINITEYFCDSNDDFMETEWVLRTPENDYMCASDW